MKKPASLFSVIILWLVALLQVLRMVFQVHVTAGGVEIPIWASLIPAWSRRGLACGLSAGFAQVRPQAQMVFAAERLGVA
jgi:hypothetical protein